MRFFHHFGAPCASDMIDEDIDSNEYLFLGNYVGKGSMQVETILLLFALKLKY
jgi:protein phosphatase